MNTLSGYIEIDFGSERLPFQFGSNAYALFCEKYKIEFWQIAESGIFGKEDGTPPDIFKLRELFYFAHVSAMRSRGEQAMVNEYRFGDLLDNTEGAITELQTAVVNAKMLGFSLAELSKGQEIKKK